MYIYYFILYFQKHQVFAVLGFDVPRDCRARLQRAQPGHHEVVRHNLFGVSIFLSGMYLVLGFEVPFIFQVFGFIDLGFRESFEGFGVWGLGCGV